MNDLATILRIERDKRIKEYQIMVWTDEMTQDEARTRWCRFCTLLPLAGVGTDLPKNRFVPIHDAIIEYRRWIDETLRWRPGNVAAIVREFIDGISEKKAPPAPHKPACLNNHKHTVMSLTIYYQRIEFLAEIRRELRKRQSTYPKIIEKKRRNGESDRRIKNELDRQYVQLGRLQAIYDLLYDNIDTIDPITAHQYLDELRRELKMRERYYPRMIRFNRMTKEYAEFQKAIWEALINYFNEKYVSVDL